MSHSDDVTVFFDKRAICLTQELTSAELSTLISTHIVDLTTALSTSGCKLIGHIKGVITTDENTEKERQLFFNTTHFAKKPSLRGSIVESVQQFNLTINIIVFGIQKQEISQIYERTMQCY